MPTLARFITRLLLAVAAAFALGIAAITPGPATWFYIGVAGIALFVLVSTDL